MKKLFFLCGLPRSGSTWLNTILNQNPDIFVTPQSPLAELLWRQYSLWSECDTAEDFASDGVMEMKIPYLKEMVKLYYENLTDSPIVIDNKRGWQNLGNIEMFVEIFGERPKIICPVRNMEEIAASFAAIFQKHNRVWDTDQMKDILMDNRQQLKTTYESEYRDCLHFVEYEDLVEDTENVLNGIYDFIEEPYFNHVLEEMNPDKSYLRVASIYKLPTLHKVNSGVVKSKTRTDEFLSDSQMFRYSSLSFWK